MACNMILERNGVVNNSFSNFSESYNRKYQTITHNRVIVMLFNGTLVFINTRCVR